MDWLHSWSGYSPSLVRFASAYNQISCPCLLSESSVNLESGKWTLNNCFRVYPPFWVYWRSGDLIVLIVTFIESVTVWYIRDLQSVPPPWGPFGFLNFFIVTGEAPLIGVPASCPLSYIEHSVHSTVQHQGTYFLQRVNGP